MELPGGSYRPDSSKVCWLPRFWSNFLATLYADCEAPSSDWVLTPGAFEPVIEEATFAEAQRILHNRTICKTNEELLESLRALLKREGRLSHSVVRNSSDVPSPSTYRLRFGSLRRACEMIGYGRPTSTGLSICAVGHERCAKNS